MSTEIDIFIEHGVFFKRAKTGLSLFTSAVTILLAISCTSKEDNIVEHILSCNNCKRFQFDRSYIPSKHELSTIHFILSNTPECNIHMMRGETNNNVYISKEKQEGGYSEAVYDENGLLVTNSYNQGTFNYYHYNTDPIMHFAYDTLPWMEWGNSEDDPTSFHERLYHYVLDLDIGIRTYVFNASPEALQEIDFRRLPQDKKLIYRLFCHLLFNKEFNISLSAENKDGLKRESVFYDEYFDQVRNKLGAHLHR